MGITLPSGLTITEAEGRILRFAENEYAYYDGIPSTQPNHITPVDVMVTNAINSNVNTADKIREVHLGLAEACDPILPMIPEETSLLDRLDEGLLKRLFEAACSVRYVLLPVATKVLHRKRPWLIPVLDNVVLKYYLGDSGVLRAQRSLSHRPVGELTNTGVGAMRLNRGWPVRLHRPLVGPQERSSTLLVPWCLGPAPRRLATAP